MNLNQEQNFMIKGNIAYANEERKLQSYENQYLICVDGKSMGVYQEIPKEYENLTLLDYTGKLIIPGMIDLHLHAPQYTFRGLGMDMELLEWLETHTFPEEAKYQDALYAKKAYQIFTDDLRNSYTTRAAIFATVHKEATLELMEQLEKSGLITYVGKVNMDRNATEQLCNKELVEESIDTKEWILESKDRFKRTKPILTPRFIPSCTDELMEELGKIQRQYHLPVQSHLSENLSEISWVKELVPAAKTYGQAYDLFGMLGNQEVPAIMAHCVYSKEEEIELLKERGVFIAHCPESNLNIASGIAPIRKYLEEDIDVGIGTDVAGGSSISMPKAITLTIQVSKIYWRLIDQKMDYLTFEDAFYLATLGGGKYFGKVGSLAAGYDFDALVIDDSEIKSTVSWSVAERVERMMYHYDSCKLCDKFVAGKQIALVKLE